MSERKKEERNNVEEQKPETESEGTKDQEEENDGALVKVPVTTVEEEMETLIQQYEMAFNFNALTVDFPSIKIKTGVTTDEMSQNSQVGELYSSISGPVGPEIIVTPVMAVEERLLWPPDHQNPKCQSLDGTYGSAGMLCDECDLKIELLFPGAPTPDEIARSCKPRIVFVVISEALEIPHIIAMGGMSHRTGSTWMRQIAVSLIKGTWKRGRYRISTIQGQKTTASGQRRVYHKYKVTPLRIADTVSPEYEALCLAAQRAGKRALGRQRDSLLMSYKANKEQ